MTTISARSLDLTLQTADGPVNALRDVFLDVQPGEFVSRIGPPGAGKPTVLRCIAALETPGGGRLRVGGTAPDDAEDAGARGDVFQPAGRHPQRTIRSGARPFRTTLPCA